MRTATNKVQAPIGTPVARNVYQQTGTKQVSNGNQSSAPSTEVPVYEEVQVTTIVYKSTSPVTGLGIVDLALFPSPPASYPNPTDPTIPLDSFLPNPKATRYGGLEGGGDGRWDWLSWRKWLMWGTPPNSSAGKPKLTAFFGKVPAPTGNRGAYGDPGNLPDAIALLSSKEQAFFKGDNLHANKGRDELTQIGGQVVLTANTMIIGAGAGPIGALAAGVFIRTAQAEINKPSSNGPVKPLPDSPEVIANQIEQTLENESKAVPIPDVPIDTPDDSFVPLTPIPGIQTKQDVLIVGLLVLLGLLVL